MIEQKQTINIKDLAIEEPKVVDAFPYVLDAMLSDEEWRTFLNEINLSVIFTEDLGSAYSNASLAAITFPKKKGDLPLNEMFEVLSERGLNNTIKDNLEKIRPSDVKILFPYTDVKEMYSLVEGSNMYPKFEDISHSLDGIPQATSFAITANKSVFDAAIFYPERLRELGKIKGLKTTLEDQLEKYRTAGLYASVAHYAAPIKLLYGPSALKLDEKDWKGLKSALLELKGNVPGKSKTDFMHLAANITILAASEFRMTDNGLKITMPQRQKMATPETSMPERKRF